MTLPHHLDAERSVLGSIMIRNQVLDSATFLQPTDFHRRAHSMVFESILALSRANAAIDYLTICEHLRQRGDLDECGGKAYVASLTDGVPASTNIEAYAAIVKEKSLLRQTIYAANRALNAAYSNDTPAKEVIAAADRDFLALQGAGSGEVLDMRGAPKAIFSAIEWRMNNPGKLTGVTTGIKKLNRETLGLQPGDLIAIGARPSMGKTALVLNIARAVATGEYSDGDITESPQGVLIFSYEMRKQQLDWRLLTAMSGIPLTRLQGGYIGDKEYSPLSHAIERLANLPIYVQETAGRTIHEMRATARKVKSERGLGLIVVDYFQLVPGSLDKPHANRNEELTDISRRAKGLAEELNVPVVLVAQLSRAGSKRQDPKPRLEDFKDCGALEQDADLALLLYRKNHTESGRTEVIIAKARNGPTGTVLVDFNRDTQTMTDWTEPASPPPSETQKKPKAPTKRKPRPEEPKADDDQRTMLDGEDEGEDS